MFLIHGVGLRLETWESQIDALSPSHRVIALDMPGHGSSAPLPDGATLDLFVDWLAAVFDDLGIEQANVAGHSMGALIASGIVATRPERVRRVALLNGVHRRSPEARAAVLSRAAALQGGARDIDGPLTRWFGADTGSQASQMTRQMLSTVDQQGYATAYAAFAGGDEKFAHAWSSVHCPALFLTGTEDANSTPEMAKAMAEAAPRGRLCVIEGHGHMVHLTAAETVNTALAAWLSEEVSPS